MLIYIIRHGETDLNTEGIIQGATDEPLNETGRELAAVTDAFAGLLETAGLQTEHFTAMLKVLGATLVTQFAADTAREKLRYVYTGNC